MTQRKGKKKFSVFDLHLKLEWEGVYVQRESNSATAVMSSAASALLVAGTSGESFECKVRRSSVFIVSQREREKRGRRRLRG